MVKNHTVPHIVKYMGSKRNILDFVVGTIQDLDPSSSKRLYDIFAGSSVVSAAFRNIRPVTCNDIQKYSGVIGQIYLQNYYWDQLAEDQISRFVEKARELSDKIKEDLNEFRIDYNKSDLKELLRKENLHRSFLERDFEGFDHVFIQRFSGTYWSLDQCIEIDSIASLCRGPQFRNQFFYNLVHGALMFAMAYCSQSTGHYAQYRDLNVENVDDILLYRRKSILTLFEQKIQSLSSYYDGSNNSEFDHRTTSQDFLDSILTSEKESIIYADPPYQFVHYSRFYHALETLVRYDYPEVRYKGRYRTDRHQSPFCIRTKVRDAFKSMFEAVIKKNSTLVISYSDNGMISLDALIKCAEEISKEYKVTIKEIDYLHSTMGRQKDKYREVKEILLIYDKIT